MQTFPCKGVREKILHVWVNLGSMLFLLKLHTLWLVADCYTVLSPAILGEL